MKNHGIWMIIGLNYQDQEGEMKRRAIIGVLFAFSVTAVIAGCAALESGRHKYLMRGQILETTGNTAYLCIGFKEGARVGQEYTVYRFERRYPPSRRSPISFNREEVGRIRITELVEEHYANSLIIAGEARVNDVVELNP